MSTNPFTPSDFDDTIFPTYKTWEEIPVSTPTFTSSTSQICYIAVSESEAINLINRTKPPVNKIAYEYPENIQKKPNEVIIKIELDISNMLDLTNKNDYTTFMKAKIQGILMNIPKPSVIRTVLVDTDTHFTNIVYRIKDYTCIRNLSKV